uniref:Ephrin RBD domain-containing protein n=1 Tax=Plectus sambesii TaxID=2011161 RepID=A0A914XFP7_9BILA
MHILRCAGLFASRLAKKSLISIKNRKARLAFARAYQTWTSADWAKVLFSDESKFNLFLSDGIQYVRQSVGTRFAARYQVPTVKHGGGSVMVWDLQDFSFQYFYSLLPLRKPRYRGRVAKRRYIIKMASSWTIVLVAVFFCTLANCFSLIDARQLPDLYWNSSNPL